MRAGTVNYLGVSNFAAWQLILSRWICDVHDWEHVSVIQPRYNAVDYHPDTLDPSERPVPELFDACRDQHVAVCPYSPLAGGFLSGKYECGTDGNAIGPDGSRAGLSDAFGPFSERAWAVLDAVHEVPAETGASPAQVALRWSMDVDAVTSISIVGARSITQLEENVAAIDVPLTDEQYDRIPDAGRARLTGSNGDIW